MSKSLTQQWEQKLQRYNRELAKQHPEPEQDEFVDVRNRYQKITPIEVKHNDCLLYTSPSPRDA